MARDDTAALSRKLVSTGFDFIPRGKHHIEQLYVYVQQNHPSLCDDKYLCYENCKTGLNQPEWKHVVRGVLNDLKKTSKHIEKYPKKGFWEFK